MGRSRQTPQNMLSKNAFQITQADRRKILSFGKCSFRALGSMFGVIAERGPSVLGHSARIGKMLTNIGKHRPELSQARRVQKIAGAREVLQSYYQE